MAGGIKRTPDPVFEQIQASLFRYTIHIRVCHPIPMPLTSLGCIMIVELTSLKFHLLTLGGDRQKYSARGQNLILTKTKNAYVQ